MSVRDATRRSVNGVYGRLMEKLCPDRVAEMAEKLGVSPIAPDKRVPSMALGSAEVRPIDMASAYATLANLGEYHKPTFFEKVDHRNGKAVIGEPSKPERRVSAALAWQVNDILKGVVTGGTGTAANIGRPAAGKTGTNQAYRDAWFVGYTPQLAVAVWMGDPKSQQSMYNVQGRRVSGGSFPAQVWHDFMAVAMANQEVLDWPKPPEELQYTVLPPPPKEDDKDKDKDDDGDRRPGQGGGNGGGNGGNNGGGNGGGGNDEERPVPYLDYAASAPLRPEALAAMLPLLERPAANPSSQHGLGRAARAAVETAREQVAALVGAAPGEVVFTSGGTEADNLAVKGTVLARAPEARHLVCSAVEHHAVLDAAAWAAADAGAQFDLAPVDGLGRVDTGRLGALLQPGRTALVAVMAANNEVGTGQPVAAVAELAHAAGAVLLCDAVQAAGLPGVDMAADGIDLLALASHKLGGPTGVGALVVRPGTTLRPLVHGGGQERGLRSGTLPAAALAGFGAAAAAALADRQTHRQHTLAALRSRLLDRPANPHPDLEVNGDRSAPDPGAGLPGLLSVRFPGRRAEDLLLLLDRHGVACSAGSACASGAVTPSHVLVAMGRDPAAARETVRFSLGHASTQATSTPPWPRSPGRWRSSPARCPPRGCDRG